MGLSCSCFKIFLKACVNNRVIYTTSVDFLIFAYNVSDSGKDFMHQATIGLLL
jgi:hypothetical protein